MSKRPLLLLLSCLMPALAHAQWDPAGTPVCVADSEQVAPVVALDDEGQCLVAWEDHRNLDGKTDVYVQRFLWGTPNPAWPVNGLNVCNVSGNQRNPRLAQDGAGGFYVAWEDDRNGTWDVYARRIVGSTGASATGWPDSGFAVCKFAGDQTRLVSAEDGYGGMLLAWEDRRSGFPQVYLRRLDRSGLPVAWPVNGKLVSGPIATRPAVTRDSLGGTYLAFESFPDVYAQHIDANSVLAGGWLPQGLRVTPGNIQVGPKVALRGRNLLVAWSDTSGACESCTPVADILVESFAPGGTAQFTNPLCTAVGRQGAIAFAEAPVGIGAVAWVDERAGWPQVYAARSAQTGAPAPTGGLGVAPIGAIQDHISGAADSQGGTYLAWEDERNGGQRDVYLQRLIDAGGADPTWPASGVRVTAGAADETSPAVVVDLGRGALVAWQDRRSGNSDIYLQRVGIDAGVSSLVGVDGEAAVTDVSVRTLPNPVSETCRIRVELTRGSATVTLRDLRGRIVRRLGRATAPGVREFAWDGKDERGIAVASGVYFVDVRTAQGVREQKLVVVR